MHELSLAQGALDIVTAAARANGAARVVSVRVEVGALAQIEPEALRFAFEVVQRGTVAEGARLEFVSVAGEAWCLDCAATVQLERRGDPCPRCDGFGLKVTAGDRMRVIDIDVDEGA